MIEKCNYCGDTHDTGNDDGATFGGMVVKTCPMVHPCHSIMWNPKDWHRNVEPDMTPHNLAWSHNPSTPNKDNS